MPRPRATSAIDRPVSSTICTASALNCRLNRRRRSGTDPSFRDQEDLSKIIGTPQSKIDHIVPERSYSPNSKACSYANLAEITSVNTTIYQEDLKDAALLGTNCPESKDSPQPATAGSARASRRP